MGIYSPRFHHAELKNRSIKRLSRFDCPEVVTDFIYRVKTGWPDLNKLEGMRVRTGYEADWLLAMLNDPSMGVYIMHDLGRLDGTTQTFAYVESNLNKGFIFYFVCIGCGKRVKHLYRPEGRTDILCRECHRLTYYRYSSKEAVRSLN